MASLGTFKVASRAARATQTPSEPDTFEFEGETFRVVEEEPSSLPLMELADAIENGVDDNTMVALAACYRMLRACIEPEDWGRFRKTIHDSGATMDDVWPIAAEVYGVVTGRPLPERSDLPAGPSGTGSRSKAGSRLRTAPPSDDELGALDTRDWLEPDPVAATPKPRKRAGSSTGRSRRSST